MLTADFDNITVLTAVNPDVFAGYAHGPIPDNNLGWKPIAFTTAIAGSTRKYDIKAANIVANPPPNQALVLNKENIGVYDILVNPPRQMCGMVLLDRPSMRRHIRHEHSGALVMPDCRAKRREDIISAHNAIKRWILQLGWQNASYVHGPSRGPDNSLVGFWCDTLERIA
ncbi:uncharacterized protein N7529_003445 [Penicillium soppii]|uniref:uncharacterized protein n=1 Tax=Penicillium soppii TaxID=69789 RepID=UPI002548A72B|nr:uncharacterized protein N7529_003445 [Penicillium soppii]KAJ5871092.1 hypothetical protein N7529_003445 [Penicillium soppii]